MFSVGSRIAPVATDAGVVAVKERSGGDLGPYTRWLDGSFKLDRINGEERILVMEIMNRDINMLEIFCEVVGFYNVNSRLNVLVDGSRIIRDLKAKVL